MVDLDLDAEFGKAEMGYRICACASALAAILGAWHRSLALVVVGFVFMVAWLILSDLSTVLRKGRAES